MSAANYYAGILSPIVSRRRFIQHLASGASRNEKKKTSINWLTTGDNGIKRWRNNEISHFADGIRCKEEKLCDRRQGVGAVLGSRSSANCLHTLLHALS